MLEHISPSSMDLLFSCPRKFALQKLEGLSSEGERTSTSFGTAWHEVKRLRSLGKSIEEAVAEASVALATVPPDEYRNAEKLFLAEQHYTRRYGGPIKPLSPDTLEQETLLWVPGVPIPVKTITDCIGELDVNESTGVEKWVVDYKTTSRLETNWVQQYRVSNQFKCYQAVAQLEYPDVVGVLLDLLHVTKGLKSERGQKGKSQSEIDGVHLYRLPIRYSAFSIEEWIKNVETAYELLIFYEKRGHYPQNAPTACKAFGSTCQFLDVCDSQSEENRELVKLTFQKVNDENNSLS